jgi:hypothetical protein
VISLKAIRKPATQKLCTIYDDVTKLRVFKLYIYSGLSTFQDIHKIKICPKTEKPCPGNCNDNEVNLSYNGTDFTPKDDSSIYLQLKGSQWFKVRKVEEIYEIFDKVGDVPYRLVAGNTGQGKHQFLHMSSEASLTE